MPAFPYTPREFQRPDGRVFLTVTYDPAHDWIHAAWTGVQTLDTIQEGGLAYVEMLRERPCPRLLNDHRELVGRFTDATDWIAQVWTPQIMAAGLHYFAHVLSPGVFGQLSMEALHQRVGEQFEMRLFDTLPDAEHWLRSCP